MISAIAIVSLVAVGLLLWQNKYEQGYWLGHWSWKRVQTENARRLQSSGHLSAKDSA